MSMDRECIIATLLRSLLGIDTNIGRNDFETRLIIQKIVYLAQESGIQLGYRFKWYAYGPYSRKLALDIGKILQVRIGECQATMGYDLATMKQLLSELKEKSIVSGKSLSYWLELVSSLHMLRYNTYPRAVDVVDELLKLKKSKFSVDDAKTALRIIEKYFSGPRPEFRVA